MEYQGVPHRFAVDHALLGFLIERPMHGYELRDRLEEGLGALWRIASSQLYSVLRRLEERGWVDRLDEVQGARPPRKVYSVSPQGERAFWAWASSPVRHLRDVRVEFLAKLYFLRRLAPERIDALATAEIEALKGLGERLEARDRVDSDDQEFGVLAIDYRRAQVAAVLRWLADHRDGLARKGEAT